MSSSFIFLLFLFSLGLPDIARGLATQFCSKDDELCGQRNANDSKLIENYSQFIQHRVLLNDHYRTETYRQAIFGNVQDFKDKVVLDVGAGVGILSFFAAQAGAKIVYAVEPAPIAEHMRTLVRENGFEDVIVVINRAIEDIVADELEPVDTIIADPFGYMALHERLIEKVIIARDRFLKPKGKMYPSTVSLFMAPFVDAQHHQRMHETVNKWRAQDIGNFHGVNLTALYDFARHDYFQHMIIESFKPDILLAKPVKHEINLKKVKLDEILDIEILLKFDMLKDAVMHGVGFWFEAGFIDGSSSTWMSTCPSQFETHWNQVRFIFRNGMKVGLNAGTMCVGTAHLKANDQYGYNIKFTLNSCPANDVAMEPLTSDHTTQTFGLSDTDILHYTQVQRFLSDSQRFTLLRQALLLNPENVQNKVVLILDSAVCVLPVIAAQAGAKKVYAHETVLTDACKAVVADNKYAHIIDVFNGTLEDHLKKEKVDLIISNQYSYLYFHNKYPNKLVAAKKFLKPNGRIFPSEVKLYVAPFADTSLMTEWQTNQADIWAQTSFHGIDMTSMLKPAIEQHLSRPIIDTFLMNVLTAPTSSETFVLTAMDENKLNELTVPVDVKASKSALVSGFALWFDLELIGSEQKITLSTAPTAPQTNVFQVRTLFNQPLFVESGHRINGTVALKSNNQGTYDIVIDIQAPGGRRQATFNMDRKTGRKVQLFQGPVIGFIRSSPTEQIFSTEWKPPQLTEVQQQQQQQQQQQMQQHASQRMPLIRYFYERIQYYYFWTKQTLIGRVTGSSLF